ncbi:hypothetical protein MUK42_10973, partial [Musa troglodytarum]
MTMVTIPTTLVAVGDPRSQSLAGYGLKPSNKSPIICHPLSFSLRPACRRGAGVSGYRGQLMVQNAYRLLYLSSVSPKSTHEKEYKVKIRHLDDFHRVVTSITLELSFRDGRRPSNASIFTGGFVLGGIVVGTLACVYAPQISKALTGTDKKDLMKRLPKFIYDEEKALEMTSQMEWMWHQMRSKPLYDVNL